MAINTKEEEKQDVAPPTASGAPESPNAGADSSAKNQPPKKKRPIIPIVAGLLAVVGLIYGLRYMEWSKYHVSTDDAQVQSDLVQISPQVNGTVTHVYVLDNQSVKAGQLLVDLDPATYQVAVDQAVANIDVAKASARGAKDNVGLTSASTAAQVTQAQAGVSQADAGVQTSVADLAKATAGVSYAQAQTDSAQANVISARASYTSALAAQDHAEQALRATQAQANTAAAGIRASQAQVRANRATADRASRDAQRYQALFAEGAISESVNDKATSDANVALAQLQASQDAVSQAIANGQTAQANVAGARSQVDAAKAAVAQARSAIVAAQGQYSAARDGVRQAIATQSSNKAAIEDSQAKVQQAQGQLTQAKTAPRQVHVSEANAGQAGARIETASAQLESAKIDLQRTKLYSPVDGKVSKKTVTVGNLVAPGTPLMSIVPSEQPWVVANFKETQLTDVKVGQPVDVEVDAFPGRVFHGKVQSLSAGTGATFALLPPDNATGNFTKVVQRIPVKIVFDSGQPDLDRLTVGMSVTATIDTEQK
jgi:membrane fusion protein (multidrug efflux system)